MSEAARLQAAPIVDIPAARPKLGTLDDSGLPQILEAASASGVGVAAILGFVVGQVADVAKTFIVETNATERARSERGQANPTE
ncbi:hypothetical protein [Streptomyces venezuelae]|uniref:hypothetical protein n=1 Tax=Streptomyces venezuelae TaxID=54571 RepID=UPI00332DFDBC